jgi:hypothetical protein
MDANMAATLVFTEADPNSIEEPATSSSNKSAPGKVPLKRVVPKVAAVYHDNSSSDLLNSFSDSVMNHPTATNPATNDLSRHDHGLIKFPPRADAILGVSLNQPDSSNVSMMNSSIHNTSRSLVRTATTGGSKTSESRDSNSLEMLPPPPPLFVSDAPKTPNNKRRADKHVPPDIDSLTDSNMMKIDLICREVDPDQNKRANVERFVSDANTSKLAAKDSHTPKQKNRRLEIACSLLKPDMKVSLVLLNFITLTSLIETKKNV